MIPAEAVEAAAKAAPCLWRPARVGHPTHRFCEDCRNQARLILEAAAPHMLREADLMRWKLDALKEWADAMVEDSYYPQYGRDVRTLLEVSSMDEAREIDAL